ncbi:TBC domain-containing protein [Toxoplasma gondii GAB2-2007-GAL-DOM2]|uniref:TBC domain-containing protein n=5 Tax=Toxoplasma gondii TaxID=5811 RepID=S7WCL1_TOXGG|nr:TBC domain-containing protein [Toxoplasma gondii GT1]KAF4641978.1 TBC domain-containing protein [Toxoplasma gondii]KFG48982.1 TBC domain-containing protein [Toxoplasma gondii GAB2-2007-GAL-DOM2]KFG49951.1 TBC domain-containing protein [Toxoplasma gondii FOU]PUA92462.1 TBC domain-containing protein [Toxoplasma gondii TgCATBr9]
MAEPWRGVCQLRSHSEAAQTLEEGERVRLGDELHADSDRRRGAEGGDASPRSSGEETGNSFGRSGSLHGSDRHAASGVSVRSSGQFLCPEATETDVSSPGGFASSSSLPSVLLASSSESSSAVFSPRTCSPASVLLPLPQNGASVSLDKSLPYEDLAQSPPCRITVAACSSASLLKSESSFSAELPCSSHSCCDTSPPQLVASSSLASVSGVARGEGEEIGQQEAPRRLSSSDPTSSSAPTEDPPPGHQAEFAARAKTEETFASLAHVREVQTKERGDQRLPGLTGGDRDGGGTGTASDGRGADGTELRGASFLWEKSPPHARDDLQTNAFRDRQRACVATGEPGMREGEKHKTETGGLREKVTSAAPGSKETSRSGNPEDTERDSCSEQAPRESRLLTAEEKLAVLQKHVQHLLAREPGAAVRTRLASRAEALRESPLDLEKLRSLCAAGMPDLCPAMRAMYWRILLGYLSHDPSRWQEDMEKKRSAYQSYKDDFIKEPELVRRLRQTRPSCSKQESEVSLFPSLALHSVASNSSLFLDPLTSPQRDLTTPGASTTTRQEPSPPCEASSSSFFSSPSSSSLTDVSAVLPSPSAAELLSPSCAAATLPPVSSPSLSASPGNVRNAQSLLAALVGPPSAEKGLQEKQTFSFDQEKACSLFGDSSETHPHRSRPALTSAKKSPLFGEDSDASALPSAASSMLVSRPPSLFAEKTSSRLDAPGSSVPGFRPSVPLFPAQKEQEETATTVSSCTLGSTAEGHQGPAVASAASGRPTGSGPHGRQLLTRPLNLESVSDHPLSQKTSSEWRSYWDDADIFDQINKDVFRTRPELAFFNYDPGLSLQHQHERLLRALQTSPGQAAPQGSPNLRSFAQGTSEEEEPIPLLVDYETLMLQKVPSQDLSRISDSSVSSGASAASHASKPGRFSLRRAFLSRKTNASSESSRSSPSVAAVRASLLPSDKGTFCSEAANGVTADGSGAALHPRLDATAEPSGSEVTRPLGSTKPPLSLSPCRGCPPNLEGGGSALVCRFSSDIGRQGSSPSPTSLSTKTGHSPSSLVRFFASGLVSPRRSQRPKPGVSPGQGHAGAAEDAPLREGLVFEPNGRGSEKTGEETQASLTLSEKKEGRAKVEEHDTHQEYFVTAKELGAHRGDGETAVGAQTQGNWPLEGTSLGSSRKLGTEVTKTTRGAANLGAAFADLNANGAVKEDRKALDFLESDGGPHGEVREIYQGNPQLDEIPVNFSVENSISVEAASADRLPPGTRMPAFTRASPSFSPLAAQETQALGRPAPVEAPVASQTPKEAKETVSPLSLVGSTSRLHSSRDPLESPEGYSPFAETPERLGEDLAKTTGEHSEERLSERDLPWAGERRLDTAGDSPQTLALGTFKQTTGQAKPPQVEEAQRPRVIVGWDEQDGQEPQNTVQKKDVPFGSTEICQLSGIPPEAPGDRGEAAAKREHRSGNQLGFSHRDNVAEATESGEETPGAPGNAAFSAFSGADLHALASDEASNSSEETVPLLQPCRAPAGMQDTCDLLEPRRHYDVLGRILFVYAKVNPGIRYVQGMNELLAPIYYVIMSDPLCTDPLQAEAEIFFCFTELMQEQRDAFCKALDPTDHGVSGRIARLSALLKKKDIVVWTHLETIGVDPQFYALRWLLLLLTQEFQLPDVLVLWDAFIADDGWPLPLLYYVCVSMILWLRPALLAGDFTACMKLLQHLPAFDPQVLLRTAVRMREEDIAEGPAAVSDVSSPSASLSARANDLERLDPLRTRTQLQSLPTSSLQVSPLFGRIRNAGNALSSFASSALATSPSSSLLPRFASGFGARDGGSVGSVEPNDRGRSGGLSEAKEGDTCGLEREGERADGVSRQVSPSFGEPVRNVETDGRVVDAGRGSVLLPSYVSVGSGNAKTLSPLEEARHDRQLVPPARRSGAPLWGGEPARRGPQERGGDAGVGREARSLSEVQAGFEGQQEERDSAKEKQKEKDRKKEREEERRRKEEERRRQVISSLPAAFLTGTTDREEKRSGVASSRQREEQRHEEGMEPRREREDRFNSRSLLPWRRGEEASERDRDFDSTLSSLGEKLGELRSFAVTSFVADTARALWAAGTGSGESFIQGEREKWTEGERE